MGGILEQTLGNSVFGVLAGFLVALGFIALYYRDKYFKTRDEFLDLADSKGFFTRKSSLMWDSEKHVFNMLLKLYGEKFYIFPQVRLSALLNVKNDVKDHDNLYRTIDHYSIDYVFFEKLNISPIIAIELNGSSHFAVNRRNRDKKISHILENAGISLIFIDTQSGYNEEKLREMIDTKLIINRNL